jgi:type I restriction enzyme S subunit
MNEQKRIISKIEEIFTRLDVGIDSLKKAKIQLKCYRQSVLKAAFEGKLTEEWRKHNTNEIESNSILLANIRKHGKSLDTDSNHMDNDIVLGTTSYPARWPLANLPEIGELKRGMSKHRPRDDKMLYGGPYPFIQTGDIRNSKGIIKNFTQTYSELGLKQSKLWPEGTLCITIAANIAETAILGIEACFPDSIVGFVPNRTICNAKFIHFFIQSIKRKLESYAPATAQKNINVGILSRLPVPIPCLLEQEQIVGLLEDQFSIIDNLAVTIDQTLNGATILRQSVLTEAFRGKLISQDPNDEPAGKLLEMIREEKSKLAEQTILQVQPGSGGK